MNMRKQGITEINLRTQDEQFRDEWDRVVRSLFVSAVPHHCVWSGLREIVSILTTLGLGKDHVMTRLPLGGDDVVTGCRSSLSEPDCLELFNGDKMNYIASPVQLQFLNPIGDPDWSLFRLECAPLEPVDPNTAKNTDSEEFLRIKGNTYITTKCLDYNRWPKGISSKNYERIIRILHHGAFVFTSKTFALNPLNETFDKRFAQAESAVFTKVFADFAKKNMKTKQKSQKRPRRPIYQSFTPPPPSRSELGSEAEIQQIEKLLAILEKHRNIDKSQRNLLKEALGAFAIKDLRHLMCLMYIGRDSLGNGWVISMKTQKQILSPEPDHRVIAKIIEKFPTCISYIEKGLAMFKG